MKDIKCPLCGEKLKMIQPYEYESIMAPGCLECGYQVLDKTDMNNTLSIITEIDPYDNTFNDKSLEHFISKFPPIMRLKIGDELVVNESSTLYHYFRVTEIDINAGIFMGTCLKTDKLEQFKFEEIVTWPWELEQKGGK